ncbi:unnamed protein product [Urochloa decumbens]|uniref:BTB domain-containing protein n=1 Tax=Urochloa decumbens TaxID=240449 RepID=A0ABC9DI70_9POAL
MGQVSSSSSSPPAGDSCSTSTIVTETVTGSHVLRIDGYSGTKGHGVGNGIRSGVFSIGGHNWCDLRIVKDIRPVTATVDSLTVPPSDLHQHLGDLLASQVGADVTFQVGDEQLRAHRYVLAARSIVFMAELFGPMKEGVTTPVRIDDMEARVFKTMLHFIYTDRLPKMDEGDEILMAQHLLVAADRFCLDRLKLICEDILRGSIAIDIAATTLVLAEQHGYEGLKRACFKFIKSPGNLKAVMASDGFQHVPLLLRSFSWWLPADQAHL